MRYSRLNTLSPRRLFDPSKHEDLIELKHYLDTNQWTIGCPFYLEEYWDNIPAMCTHKYAQYMLRNLKPKKRKTKSPK